eukprot:s2555_g18.t1
MAVLEHININTNVAPYMDALAAAACQQGGRILEVGFGLGLSAAAIQRRAGGAGVTEHVILEANEMVMAKAGFWSDEAEIPTVVLGGFWQELVESLEDGSFDGILFDAYPLSPGEAAGDGEVGAFFVEAARLLRPGGCFSFYYDAGRTWLESVQSFRDETVPKLLKAGFREVKEDQVLCRPRPGCSYFWKDRFLIPMAIR